MTVSKDGVTMMYLLVEENIDKLVEETGAPRETWENAAAYDASVGLPTSKVYVVAREDPKPWRQMVSEILDDGKLVVWPEETPEYAAEMINVLLDLGMRHYFLVDVSLSTEVNI